MNIYILNDINFYGNEYLQLRIRSGSLNKFHLYSNKIIKEFKPDNIDPPIYIREIIKHQHYDLIPEALRRMEQEKSHNGWSKTNIIIENNDNKSSEEELVDDMLEIITVFSSRLYGMRSYKNNTK